MTPGDYNPETEQFLSRKEQSSIYILWQKPRAVCSPWSFAELNIENPSRNGEEFLLPGISLKLFIEYDEHDDLSNRGNKVIMDVDPDNKVIVRKRSAALMNSFKNHNQA
ncbi:hypothetical protein [Nitrosomonas communis]|uniref:hypothetical protein n=1 Tax=Nitrosomonas communis TaxID=44574 RepID=UPI0026F05B56|nr:hypothetical protein [Nitrosomonas communis]MCO6426693.1 hypothetical protein [Nitrosomonas communis]